MGSTPSEENGYLQSVDVKGTDGDYEKHFHGIAGMQKFQSRKWKRISAVIPEKISES